jgi:hypothetical protein
MDELTLLMADSVPAELCETLLARLTPNGG